MVLNKKAVTKYLKSMEAHHVNFFLWDSKIHDWIAAYGEGIYGT